MATTYPEFRTIHGMAGSLFPTAMHKEDADQYRLGAGAVAEFRDRGFVRSMIVITHDLSVLYQIADTILVMYAGKLAEKAPAETMIEAPAR